jgi:MazG family protein
MHDAHTAGPKFQQLVDILAALRSPGGCPWDREQDEKSIADYFLEEVYEALDALVRGDRAALAEELGDVLMEVVFLSRIAEEKGDFSVADALDGISRKLVRRHPHVFGSEKAESARDVLDIWARRKKEEKGRSSHFEGISPQAPSLLAAFQIGNKVAAFGFDWPAAGDALAKAREELGELEEAMAGGDAAHVEEEMGDCLFALANVARKLKLNPEVALRQGNAKFIRRFTELEAGLEAEGKKLGASTLEEMDAVWERAKASRKGSGGE